MSVLTWFGSVLEAAVGGAPDDALQVSSVALTCFSSVLEAAVGGAPADASQGSLLALSVPCLLVCVPCLDSCL